MTQTTTPRTDHYLSLFQQRADRFTEVVDAVDVSGGAWDGPSPCDGWSARDVVGHVLATQRDFLATQGLDAGPAPDLADWERLVERVESATDPVRIALVGKYNQLADAYMSVIEALNHAGSHHGGRVEVVWVDSERLTEGEVAEELATCDGILVPGGFGVRGIEGKIHAARYARENEVPYLGICLGMQIAVVEFARSVCNVPLPQATSFEFDSSDEDRIIVSMPEHHTGVIGGTMRRRSSTSATER